MHYTVFAWVCLVCTGLRIKYAHLIRASDPAKSTTLRLGLCDRDPAKSITLSLGLCDRNPAESTTQRLGLTGATEHGRRQLWLLVTTPTTLRDKTNQLRILMLIFLNAVVTLLLLQ